KMHHQRRISRSGYAASCEVHDRKLSVLMNFKQQLIRYAQVLSLCIQLILGHILYGTDLAVDQPHMANSFDNVACSRLTFCTDHGCALADAAQSFAEILRSANKWNGEFPLVDVEH